MRRALLLLAACGHPPLSTGPALVPPPRCPAPVAPDLTGGCNVVGQCEAWSLADGTALEGGTLPIGDVLCQASRGRYFYGHCDGGELRTDRDLSEIADVDGDNIETPDGVHATDVPGLSFTPEGDPAREIDLVRGADPLRIYIPIDPGDLTPPIAGSAAIEGDAPHPMLLVSGGVVTARNCVHTLADVEEVAITDENQVTVYEASTGKVIAQHELGDDLSAWLDTL